MPTQKFINLGEGKKEAILTAMCREFMNIPYSEIRISSLIQKAGISRASYRGFLGGCCIKAYSRGVQKGRRKLLQWYEAMDDGISGR